MLEVLLANPEIMALVGGLGASVASSVVSALFPDKASSIMKVLNVFAVNVGNAKNDPGKNK